MRLNLRVEYSHNSNIAKVHAKITFIDFYRLLSPKEFEAPKSDFYEFVNLCTVEVPKIDIKLFVLNLKVKILVGQKF